MSFPGLRSPSILPIPHGCRKGPDATSDAADEVRIGQLPLNILPQPVGELSKDLQGIVATKLTMDADNFFLRGSADDDNPNNPSPCGPALFGGAVGSTGSPGIRP